MNTIAKPAAAKGAAGALCGDGCARLRSDIERRKNDQHQRRDREDRKQVLRPARLAQADQVDPGEKGDRKRAVYGEAVRPEIDDLGDVFSIDERDRGNGAGLDDRAARPAEQHAELLAIGLAEK
ncbi:MAG: hypothetical protein IPK23_12270 [Rhizobiales bacterium]|nr:hypothetical protein [Hyphomicrobiales bacterium]